MKRFLFFGFLLYSTGDLASQTLLCSQSFEDTSSDTWFYNATPAEHNSDGDIWGIVTITDGNKYFNPAPDGDRFWEFYDIDEIPGMPADQVAHLTFETVDISERGYCMLSFSYCNRGLDTADFTAYAVALDNGTEWDEVEQVMLPKHSESTSEWFPVEIMLPAEAQFCQLRFSVSADYSADCGGFDDIRLTELPADYPFLNIAAPQSGYVAAAEQSTLCVSGICTNCVGRLSWSNLTSGVCGTIAATSEWCVAALPLTTKRNFITVSGTNSSGIVTADEVMIYRDPGVVIAFTAFNAQRDAFAFAALSEIPPAMRIIFSDEEWNGTNFVSQLYEGDIVWNSESGLAPGNVVIIDFCDNTENWSASHGQIESVASRRMDLAQSGEDIYAYLGESREPLLFLSALSTADGELAGTGLCYGESAIAIPASQSSGAEYDGPRCGYECYDQYRPLLCDQNNWTTLALAPNAAGFAAGDDPATASISILTPEIGNFVDYTVPTIVVSGTVANAVGHIVWSNAANGANGEVAVENPWIIDNVPLEPGENTLTVTTTNSADNATAASIKAVRGLLIDNILVGAIAFTAFNSATDSFSFVAIRDLPQDTTIRFTDEEWDRIAFGTGEDDLVWSNLAPVTAGTIIAITNCDSSTTVGAIEGVVISGNLSISQSGEDIYAYQGIAAREPNAFLAAVSTGNGDLRGTGLHYGETAVALEKNPTAQCYCGDRSGVQSWNNYLLLVNNSENWSIPAEDEPPWGSTTAFSIIKAATVLLLR